MGRINPGRGEEHSSNPLLGKVIKSLSSLKLTVVIMLWIAAMCIIATFIPQQESLPDSGMPIVARVLRLFSLSDMFHSLWFIIPTIALSLNVSVCMARWAKAFRQRLIPRMPSGCSHEDELPAETDIKQISTDLFSMVSRGYWARQEKQGSSWLMFGEKSRMRAFAPLLVHASILVILLGVALGTLGFRASIEIPEGGTSDAIRLDNGTFTRLPFKVRCDGFFVEYYENGMPKEYRSDLAFIRSEQVVMKTPVMVNHPRSFEGILFSQSGYNRSRQATIGVRTGSVVHLAVAEEGKYFILRDKVTKVHVVRIVENVMRMGPAVQLMVEMPQGQRHLWIFEEIDRMRDRYPGLTERIPEFNPSFVSPYTFTLEKMEARYTTILGLNRDPGVPFVAIGALLFLTGILVVFLIPRNRIWVCIEQCGKQLKLKIVQSRGGKIHGLDKDILNHIENLRGGRP